MPDAIEAASDRIGIVLADDHPLIRGGLKRVLELEPDLAVVGEAGDVDGALTLTRVYQPRVVVLDLNMPGEPTLTAIPQFREAAPGSAILVLTMEAEPGFARRASPPARTDTFSRSGPSQNWSRPFGRSLPGGPISIRRWEQSLRRFCPSHRAQPRDLLGTIPG